jgi:putative peptidoglycan lipid II flippase
MTDASDVALEPMGNRSLLASTGLVAVLTVGVKAVGGLRDLVLARKLGASGVVDAYLLALATPTLVVNLLVGAIPVVLIPAISLARRSSAPHSVQRLSVSITWPVLGVLVAASTLLALGAHPLMAALAPSLDAEELNVGVTALRILAPLVAAAGMGLIATAILQERRHFALPSVVPVISSVGALAVLLLAPRAELLTRLAWVTVVGVLVETVLLSARARRLGLNWFGQRIDWSLTTQLLRQMMPLIGGSAALAAVGFVDLAVAAHVGRGAVAEFTYGTRLVAVLLAVAGGSVGATALPHFSALAVARDRSALHHEVRSVAKRLLVMSAAITLPLVVFSRPIADLFLSGSAVDAAALGRIAWVQAIAAVQLPFYVLAILYGRGLSSMGRNGDLLRGSVISFAANVVGDVTLAGPLGLAGIALSTTVSVVIVCSWLAHRLTAELTLMPGLIE